MVGTNTLAVAVAVDEVTTVVVMIVATVEKIAAAALNINVTQLRMHLAP